MKYLLIAPQLGFDHEGQMLPGGLFQFGRCVARVLASFDDVSRLAVWAQVDRAECAPMVASMIQPHAHARLDLDVRLFAGSRTALSAALATALVRREFDRVMYVLLNQSVLAALPGHPPYDAWLIGREVFAPVSAARRHALLHADRLISISRHTKQMAAHFIPGLPDADVVHLCTEPVLQDGRPVEAPCSHYGAADREPAVLIVGNMFRGMLYKGHQHLLWAWPEVIDAVPNAELWIAGEGAGAADVMASANALPETARRRVKFLGRLTDRQLEERYTRCRVFAMPSNGEGFGLVYVEAARHGVPCIAGKYDSGREIVIHRQTGVLVEQHPHDTAQACIRLLADDRLANALGRAGQLRYLHNFTFGHFRSRLARTLGFSVAAQVPLREEATVAAC